MEQLTIDFITKASELVLHNRLPDFTTSQTPSIKPINPKSYKFQLHFEQKFNFESLIPLEWSSQPNKLLIIEFFLCPKAKDTRFLVEQWIFDISQISGKKLEDTIDSPQNLHKKLSVLLRSISLLTMTLPLAQKIQGKQGQYYTLEHSINFTRHTLSAWHPSVYDDRDLNDWTSPDFVLPGRTFSFKVNYSKTLKFLHNFEEEIIAQEDLEIQFTKSPQIRGIRHVGSNERLKELSLARGAHSDNYYNKDMKMVNPLTRYLNDSPPHVNPWQESFLQLDVVPIPVCPQRSMREIANSPVSRKSSGLRAQDVSKATGPTRLRVQTLDSESLWDAEIYIRENEEDKFTEVLSLKELSGRSRSPTRLSLYQREMDEYQELQMLRKFSEDFEKSKRRLSICSKPMEKMVEQTDDDKIAELIHSIEELKILTRTQSTRSSISSGNNTTKTDKEDSQGKSSEKKEKGLRFESDVSSRKESGEKLLNPFLELNGLKDLYVIMKRSGSAK